MDAARKSETVRKDPRRTRLMISRLDGTSSLPYSATSGPAGRNWNYKFSPKGYTVLRMHITIALLNAELNLDLVI